MIRIYYGRENLDKEKFMYEKIASSKDKAIVLVPDQYTLEAEKQAFRYLGVKGMMDISIMAFSRLGDKLLEKFGGKKNEFINDYGKYILLSKIIKENADNLKVFKGQEKKSSFVKLVCDFIGDVKKYQPSLDVIDKIKEKVEDSMLKNKLSDLSLISKCYENAISGKYTDSDDRMNLVLNKIQHSDEIKESHVWVYGFDTFTPKYLEILGELTCNALEVNVILTYDKDARDQEVFNSGEKSIEDLKKIGDNSDDKIKIFLNEIDQSYLRKYENDAVPFVEKELYSMPYNQSESGGIDLIKASNAYAQAETAASYILELVREENYRYKDIAIVCNDQEKDTPILERVFQEYGIKVFVDKKRNLLNSYIIICILSLLKAVEDGYKTFEIMQFLKCGFTSLAQDQIEDIENYVYKYRIKGNMWKKPFAYGEKEYGEQGLQNINQIREIVYSLLSKTEDIVKSSASNREFANNFYIFLRDELNMPKKIEELEEIQKQMGQKGHEFAEETAQVWNSFVEILEQIVALASEDEFDISQFIDLLEVGLGEIEIGIIPPTADGIMIGTTQRSRIGRAKAVLVLSANEGLLPKDKDEDALFNEKEQDLFVQLGGQLTKLDSVMADEEKTAIYRLFSAPTSKLFVCTCASDLQGEALRESSIFTKLCKIYKNVEIKPDVLNSGQEIDMVYGKVNTLKHLTEKIRGVDKSGNMDPVWKETLMFFKDSAELKMIRDGIMFTNKQAKIDDEKIKKLYLKADSDRLTLSPSRLERFSRCPFSHFVSYGLRLDERQVFEVSPREIGDVYHSVIMKFSQHLSSDGKNLNNPESLWNTITLDECKKLVEKIALEEFEDYKEGMFKYGKLEEYRAKRLIENCNFAAWSLVKHVRAGMIEKSSYETEFKEGADIKPVTIHCDSGDVTIEGKIDRVDYMPGDRVKVIDYKTGKEEFSVDEALKGYRLQLLLYLKAAEEEERKPTGIFYFLIKEPSVDVDKIPREKLENDMLGAVNNAIYKDFKMNGLYVNDEDVIASLDKDATLESKSSLVVPLTINKSGERKGSFLNEKDFADLQHAFDDKVKEICERLQTGDIDIAPMKNKLRSACTYCLYKGICRFDTIFDDNSYVIIS